MSGISRIEVEMLPKSQTKIEIFKQKSHIIQTYKQCLVNVSMCVELF